MSGYLGSRASFNEEYGKLLSRGRAGEECAANLQRLTGPFLLRRLKSDPAVSCDLPPKVEQRHVVELTPQQGELYALVANACMKNLDVVCAGPSAPSDTRSESQVVKRTVSGIKTCSQSWENSSVTPEHDGPSGQDCHAQKFKRSGCVFRMLHALRKVCNHPSNLEQEKWPEIEIPHSEITDVDASGKTMLLQTLLEQILGQDQKAVIFCQYLHTVRMLTSQIMKKFGVKSHTLVGELTTYERARRVQAFQETKGKGVMVLTLAVGGTGLTLHAASHVIHFDRCYNPAKENQGSDRIHRLGQRASCVFVHLLLTKGTFEERVDEILAQKSRLSGMALPPGEGWLSDLSNQELKELFLAAGGLEAHDSAFKPVKRRRQQI